MQLLCCALPVVILCKKQENLVIGPFCLALRFVYNASTTLYDHWFIGIVFNVK